MKVSLHTLCCAVLCWGLLDGPALAYGEDPPQPAATPPHIPSSPYTLRTEEHVKLLTDWLTRPRLALTGPEWELDLQSAKESQWQTPNTGTRVAADQLPEARKLLLESASQLVATQFKESAAGLVEYMKAHGEVPDPEWIATIRRQAMFEDPQVETVLDRFWKLPELPVNTHWVAGVSGSGTVMLWTTEVELPRDAVSSLGADWGKSFGNINSTRHGFVSTVLRQDVLARDGKILWGDVSFVTIGDAALQHQPIIVSLRFWWDPVTKLWHPSQFSKTSTGPKNQTVMRIVY